MKPNKAIKISAFMTNRGGYSESVIPYIPEQETRNNDGIFINGIGEIYCDDPKGPVKIGRIFEHGLIDKFLNYFRKKTNDTPLQRIIKSIMNGH